MLFVHVLLRAVKFMSWVMSMVPVLVTFELRVVFKVLKFGVLLVCPVKLVC